MSSKGPLVVTSTMEIDGRSFLLADIVQSNALVGVTNVTGVNSEEKKREQQAKTSILYMGEDPVINVLSSPISPDYGKRQIFQVGICKNEHIIHRLAIANESYFLHGLSIDRALSSVFDILAPGLYVCYETTMIATDGIGNFFWNAYGLPREIDGASRYNRAIGKHKNYTPCFLVPTKSFTNVNQAFLRNRTDKLARNKGRIGGIALHLSGLFSALLDGHHSAMVSLINDIPFQCLLIERVEDVIYDEKNAAKNKTLPRVMSLYTPYVTIPVGKPYEDENKELTETPEIDSWDIDTELEENNVKDIPRVMLEDFLACRREFKPKSYDTFRIRADKSMKTVSKKSIPEVVTNRSSLMPKVEDIESFGSLFSVSDEELGALLTGDVSLNGKVIINTNYTASIMAVLNFLRYKSPQRLVSFATLALKNNALALVHQNVAKVLSTVVTPHVYAFFAEYISTLASEDKDGNAIFPIAEEYIKRYRTTASPLLRTKNTATVPLVETFSAEEAAKELLKRGADKDKVS